MKTFALSLLAFGFIAFIYSSCGPKPKYTTVKFDLGTPFDLGVGKTARSDDGLNITFNAVSEDSRCPEGTTCMWAGKVVANITIADSSGSQTHNFTMEGKTKNPTTKRFGDYKVSLSEVSPYPKNGEKIDKATYSAKLTVKQ